MNSFLKTFSEGISQARTLSVLYDFLKGSVGSPYSYEDVLRSQIVYAVSAFDKLMHDMIRAGMVDIYIGTKPPTPKYLGEGITLHFHSSLVTATIPPKEYLFEQEVIAKLRILSFQEPTKVADGLSFIWNEKNKWQKIASQMGWDVDDAKKKLKLIATRRNAIVHESDIDPVSGMKNAITRPECDEITNFLELCGKSIVALI
jgi:hypothetical protein